MTVATKSMGVFARINRPAPTVWSALTDATELKGWLGTEIELDAVVGGRFHVRSGTPLCSGEHSVTAIEAGESITFRWLIEGVATEVHWELAAQGDVTTVTFRHRVAADTTLKVDDEFGGECGVLKEMWAYVAGLLKTYLELGEAKCRLDPDRTPSTTITHELTVAADSARVFAALVEPERIKEWNSYATAPAVERRVGGNYSFGWKSEKDQTDGPGELVEYEDGHKITYTWYGKPPTLVSWTVEPLPDDPSRTKIQFTHSGFDVDQNMLVGWNLGWPGFLFDMALLFELGASPGWSGEAP